MRKSLAPIALFSTLFLTGPFPARCQTALVLPGCEASSEVRKILDEKLDEKTLDKMKFAEGVDRASTPTKSFTPPSASLIPRIGTKARRPVYNDAKSGIENGNPL